VLGAVGCWALVRHVGGRRWTAALATSTWLLATPALNYSHTDLWLGHFLGWSLYPWLLLCTRRILDHELTSQPWRGALQLGLVAGLLGVNGHLGQVPVLVLPMAVMCAAEPRATTRRLIPLIVAAAVGAAIASPVVVRLVKELPLFPDIPRESVEAAIDGRTAADLVLRPLLDVGPDGLGIGERGLLIPFFGGPMFLLAAAYVVGAGRSSGFFRQPEAGRLKPWRYHQGLVAAFVASTILLFDPAILDQDFSSGGFLFRDPMTLFGIVLGSLAFEALARRSATAAAAVGAVQMLTLSVCAWPFAWAAWESSGAERAALARTATTEGLREWANRIPGRWYLAPQLDALVREGRLQDAGLWRETWIYRGLPVVNGSFKGVSTDVLYPSGSLPIGRIVGDAATVQNAATLAGLGIGAVLATGGEPVAPELVEVARYDAADETMRLLRHPSAWPGGAFVMAATLATPLPELPDCRFPGLFCRDFSPVIDAGVDSGVSITRRHGTVEARFAPRNQSRVLVVSEMFRPEWTARTGRTALPVAPAWGGMIAVTVPPGADAVELRYRPAMIMALTALSALVIAAAVVTLAWRRSRVSARA
jgi:hypothetical protein